MKRSSPSTSSASRAKRSCASGSRSIAINVPCEPRRSATSRACPPSPNVQSITVCPGCGASSASSSSASTGVWARAPAALVPPVNRSRSLSALAAADEGRPRDGRRFDRLISSSVVDMRGYLGDAAQQRRSVLVPGVLAPQLQAIADANDDHVLLQLSVLAEEAGDHDPPGRVEIGGLRAAVEEALELRATRRERRQLGERAAGVALVLLWVPNAEG